MYEKQGLNELPEHPIPIPVLKRLLMLGFGGLGCLLLGVSAAISIGDILLFGMSAFIAVFCIVKAFLLRKKLKKDGIHVIEGVCTNTIPKILGRYNQIELTNETTGDETFIVLPKKITFKLGTRYVCYFDTAPVGAENNARAAYDGEFPTNGFLGYEPLGQYREKPVTATVNNESNNENVGTVETTIPE